MDDCSNNIQNLGFTGVRNISLVVKQDGIEQWWNHAIVHHLQVIGFLDVDIHKFQDLFLDCPQASNFWSFSSDVSYSLLVDQRTDYRKPLTFFGDGIRD